MKINGSTSNPAGGIAKGISGSNSTDSVSGTKEKRGSTRAPEIDTGISDKVAISGRAKEASKAKAIAHSSPDVDEARVAKLKAAIQNGSYKVDADKIADRLVDEHLSTAF